MPIPDRDTRPPPTSLDAVETPVDPGDTYGSADYAADEVLASNFRHSGWRRLRAQVADGLVRAGVPPARVERFRNCGHHAWVMQDADDPTRLRINASYCHDRFCVPCATERSRRIAASVASYLDGRPARFITLTLKHSTAPLADQLRSLGAAFRRLRQRKLWVKAVDGGICCLEVKWSAAAGRWHPHLHIVCTGRYLDQRALSAAWRAVTRDSYIVDIRFVRDPETACRYVAKYASKPMTKTFAADDNAMAEAIRALHGRRLVVVFGDWRDICLDDFADEADWRPVCLLADLIRNTQAGDVFAARIYTTLMRSHPCPPPNASRPP